MIRRDADCVSAIAVQHNVPSSGQSLQLHVKPDLLLPGPCTILLQYRYSVCCIKYSRSEIKILLQYVQKSDSRRKLALMIIVG